MEKIFKFGNKINLGFFVGLLSLILQRQLREVSDVSLNGRDDM